jgi:hypothetical protein
MRSVTRLLLLLSLLVCAGPASAAAQDPGAPPPPAGLLPPLPPATMLEGFKQPIGSMLTLGYDELGEVDGVSVDVREIRDTRGGRVRGLVVEVTIAPTVREQSLVDADEIPGLLKAVDDLVAITANPTQFKSFEVRYMTRGELALTASSSRNRGIVYGVEVGRLSKVRRALTAGEMHQLRTLFDVASTKLATLIAEK